MEGQISIFDALYPKFKIDKPVRLIELDNLEIIVSNYGDIYTTHKNKIRSNGRKNKYSQMFKRKNKECLWL